MRLALVLILLLAACGRPLTVAETDLATRMFGTSLDAGAVRFYRNGFVGMRSHLYPVRPRTTCRERILPPADQPFERGRAAGIVLFNTVNVRPDVLRPDFARQGEGLMSLGAAMYLVHELTHVWQWQNRALTGYSPLRVAREHAVSEDPYLFDTGANARFLDYGYEQQASLVEEYLCCQVLDPEGARTGRLHRLISQVMTPGDLPEVRVLLPWRGVEREGICG
ncbi:MAG: hypothetical protein LCH92_01110 [Proteobacteria bacterium]|nr:hypothetical protein [Pseudomonadota bacterium]